jgi:dipeptidyl aminopeptidase/acylaminoacyl peptidase
VATAPYGSWTSPITSTLIVERSIGLPEVRLDGDAIYWLEQRPRENRTVVVRGSAPAPLDVVDKPFNVRSRVHEYGGGAWTVSDGTLYFSNDQDRRLYRQRVDDPTPQPMTQDGPWRYADGIIDRARGRWIGIREDHSNATKQYPENTIVAVDLEGSGSNPGVVLVAGHDFFSSPRLSPDGRRLAWIAWDLPNMPWIGTTLYVAEFGEGGRPAGKPVAVAGGPAESIAQPEWSPDGSMLAFVSDRSGWWNLYAYDVARRATKPLAPRSAEFAQPQWTFGMSSYAFAGRDRLVASYIENGIGRLALVDLESGRLTDINVPFSEFRSLRGDGGDLVVFVGGAYDRPASVVLYDLGSRTHRVLQQANNVADDPELRKYLAPPQPVAFPTDAGQTAYGLYYPPTNPDYAAPAEEKPPLLVKCHGGPTSSASSSLNLNTQFWTSRGIAVLDVNYGGSTGYGREYRNRLHLKWGVVDVDDSVNGAKFLAQQGLVDGSRAVITGGSAGGYTALAALTFRDFFQGGASYYGISDLAALAKDTHKFESRYPDWLIGPYPGAESVYRARSPLFHVEQLSRPVIFFQGSEDRVVPPDQTAKMVEALRHRQVPVGFLLFSGEQHGFRRAANIQRALDGELYFYAFEVFHTDLSF